MDQVKAYISIGRTEEAIELLLRTTNFDEFITNQILILSGQYYRWKINNRLGMTDNSVLHKIELGLLELVNEIESPMKESFLIQKSTSFSSEELYNAQKSTIEASDIKKIDFNVSKEDAFELIFHSKFWKRKESVYVPKKFTIQELIDAFIDHYMLLDVLAPFEYHRVKWIFLVNYREIIERENTLLELNIKDRDNIKIKGVFTKYKIKMIDGDPELEIEDECEDYDDFEEDAFEDFEFI